jgi:hypothetical protein
MSHFLHTSIRKSFILFVCMAAFVSLLFSPLALRADSPMPLPDAESRSFIVGVNAGAANGKADSQTAAGKLVARGKQLAREKIEARLIQSRGHDIDFELAKASSGFGNILKKEEIPQKNGTRKPSVWMEAEGAFTLRSPATGGRPDEKALDRANFLDIRIWTDKKEYKTGEKIVLYMQGNRDFHGKVIKIDPTGGVHQILPNNYRQLSSFERGKRYQIPDEGDRYQLMAQDPPGKIRFVVYATPLPMSQVNLATTAGGIFKYRSSEKFFGRSVRHVIPPGEEQIAEFYEALWEIETAPRQ